MAKNGGALPRAGPRGQVDIPALSALSVGGCGGREGLAGGGEERGKPVPETRCAQDNSYSVWRLASVRPPVQRLTGFFRLLHVSAREARRAGTFPAEDIVALAHDTLSAMRGRGRCSVDVFEVVSVLRARLTSFLDGGRVPKGGCEQEDRLPRLPERRTRHGGRGRERRGTDTTRVLQRDPSAAA